jgi:predicted AAA+ superfamily ATPase
MSVSSEQPFISRHLKSLVEEALDDFRVVIINGPRQAGKTTLLRQLHAARGGSFRTLDRADVLQAAKADPLGFVADAVRPAFIDEIQGSQALSFGDRLMALPASALWASRPLPS